MYITVSKIIKTTPISMRVEVTDGECPFVFMNENNVVMMFTKDEANCLAEKLAFALQDYNREHIQGKVL